MMNTEKRLNQLLKDAEVNISEAVDQQILSQSKCHLGLRKSSTSRRTWLSYMPWVAALLVVLLGLQTERVASWLHRAQEPPAVRQSVTPPTRVLTMQSMRRAYLQGDIEALENHLDRAMTLVGPRPTAMLEKMNAG